MPIFRGTNGIAKIFRGTTEIDKVFRGTELLFSATVKYELIADVNVTSNTTQIDFDNLNITKDDELRLVYTFVGDNATFPAFYDLTVNNITSNYTYQELTSVGTNFSALRASNGRLAVSLSVDKVAGFADIKVSNNDRFVFQSHFIFRIGSNSNNMNLVNYNVVNTSTVTSITKLSVVSSRTNGIAVGSRLQLYKVVR